LFDFTKPVLAIDSTLGGCIAAVVKGDHACVCAVETEREQSAKLMPIVQQVMQEAGIAFDDLGLIVTTIGPGSFTGLRISLSAARALALSLDLPLQGVTTFEVMARSAVPEEKPCMVVLETKRTDFYVQSFDSYKKPMDEGRCMEEAALMQEIAGGDYILCGDGLVRLGIDGRARTLLNPGVLARAGLARFIENGGEAGKAEPLYLRGADVSMSNKAQRIISNMPIS